MLQQCYSKKISLVFIACFFALISTSSAGASTLIWSGGDTGNLASSPGNWNGGVSPRSGDTVVFDITSSKNCTWDLDLTLSSFNINPGYTGTVTIAAGLTIDNGFTWTGDGGDYLASNPANWSGGTAPQDGDNINFEGINDCQWDLDISPASLKMAPGFTGTIRLTTDLSIAGNLSMEGGVLDLNKKALSVDGDLLIGFSGTLYATSSNIKVKGNWINNGAFDPGTSTVILNGANQIVYDNNIFYNLVKTTSSAGTLYFETGVTQTILNNLTLTGTAGRLLLLRGTAGGRQWYLDARGPRQIAFAGIMDLNSINPVNIDASDSADSGNNININFSGPDCLIQVQ